MKLVYVYLSKYIIILYLGNSLLQQIIYTVIIISLSAN